MGQSTSYKTGWAYDGIMLPGLSSGGKGWGSWLRSQVQALAMQTEYGILVEKGRGAGLLSSSLKCVVAPKD